MGSIVSVDTLQGLTSGQVTLPTGHKIKGTDVGSVVAPGTLVQRQVYSFKSQVVVSSQSFVDVFTCSFTPKFASSRLYLNCNLHYGKRAAGEMQFPHKFLRNSSEVTNNMTYVVGGSLYDVMRFPDTTQANGHMHILYQAYDEPATTSLISYKFQLLKTNAGYADVYINFSGNTGGSVITIDEIAQ
jgi:hypothetical protein